MLLGGKDTGKTMQRQEPQEGMMLTTSQKVQANNASFDRWNTSTKALSSGASGVG